MDNLNDLNLCEEIVPLFDYTINEFSKKILYKIFEDTLPTIVDITNRQDILKGFIVNDNVFSNYSYSRLDFYEVYSFLNDAAFQNNLQASKMRILLLEKERNKAKSRFIQFVTLFYKLEYSYFKRIDVGAFPGSYKEELVVLDNFLTAFNFKFYEELIREGEFTAKHLLVLSNVILDQQLQGGINVFYKVFFLFEAYLSISKGVIKYKFCFPFFTEKHLFFAGVFYPLLKNPVNASFSDNRNVILLTGANMSGKSTFLKSIGLSIFLALLGIAVPAAKMELPFFDHITISINHNDDISNGYSHFMNEIMRLKQVIIQASENKRCFVIFDELFNGTNVEDAVQITSTTIKGLVNFKNSFFFISTHLHQLKDIEQVKEKQIGTYYMDCDLKNNVPIFNFKIREGLSDLKVGQLLFEKEGLNKLLNIV